jgi:hypothetical protein
MRNMSFALTEQQIRDRTKTVTRRLGWEKLKAGELVRPVRKCMGLKPGQKIEPIGDPIRIVSVRRERLDRMTEDSQYGIEECRLEGFGNHPDYRWPSAFVQFFCDSHRPCESGWLITRIEFEYPSEPQTEPQTDT